MSYQILHARWLAPNIRWLCVQAPHVTRNAQAGQFVIVRAEAEGERVPLTIVDSDRRLGTIELIVQVVGATTKALCSLQAGQNLPDIVGPLGHPTELRGAAHAVLIGGGVGTAVIFPQARALKRSGSWVTVIIGGRTREAVLLEERLSSICDDVYPCTDDGSYGFHGLVTQRLEQLIAETSVPIDLVLCAGPVPMMRAVAEVTRGRQIRTVASLNPIMIDGTGMCGGCRVTCEGKTRFACVDGPEFDAHQVNFQELSERLTAYREFERAAMGRSR